MSLDNDNQQVLTQTLMLYILRANIKKNVF